MLRNEQIRGGVGEKEAGAVREQPHEPKVQIRRNQSLQQRRGIKARDYKQRRRSLSEQIKTVDLLKKLEPLNFSRVSRSEKNQ